MTVPEGPAFPDGPEIALPSGDVTDGVVRIGDTVRRPHSASSDFVRAYLDHLAAAGFDGAPRFCGVDAQGRDVLTFIDGDVPGDPVEPWAAADDVLPGVARLLRRLHDASRGFAPPARRAAAGRPLPPLPPDEERIVSHRDVTPQNTVLRGGTAHAVVDFDLADWTTRSVDLANTAMHWLPMCDPLDRTAAYDGIDVGRRLRLLLDAYGRDVMSPQRLLDAAAVRFAGLFATMSWNAEHLGGGWQRMWDQGIGDVIRRRTTWFESVSAELVHAL